MGERMSELHAMFGVCRHLSEDALGRAGTPCRECQSPVVQNVNGNRETLSNTSENMISRNFNILIEQFGLSRSANAEFPYSSEHAKARHIRSYNESGESGNNLAASFYRRLSECRNHAGSMCIPDPDLVSLQYPALA